MSVSELQAEQHPAVGEVLSGQVSTMSELGFGYVREHKSGRMFALSRKFVDTRRYDALRVGDRVAFRENGHNSVAVLID